MTLQKTSTRPGLTLFEVVLAMFIFGISSIAIWQLVTMGSDRALEILQETRTSARCQAKMAEFIVGAAPMTASGSYANFDDDDKDLQWKADISQSELGTGLFNVKVFVKMEMSGGRFVESQLSQIILDPTIRGSSQDRSKPPVTSTPTTDPATDPATDPSTTTPSTTTPSATTPSPTTPSMQTPSVQTPSIGGAKTKGS